MITNILQTLHTTAAYQAAVTQLLVGEANFAAKQLDLTETVPVVASATNQWEVEAPTAGVGGAVSGPNYYFWFHDGKLRSVREVKRFHNASPPVWNMDQLAEQKSLLDTNTAYQLARQWLGRLSVDVAELEQKYPPTIFQLRILPKGPDGQRIRGADLIDVPLFQISWGNSDTFAGMDERRKALLKKRADPNAPVFVEILGTTKDLLALEIRDSSLLKRPALQLTNKDELLGPTPPPRHFVEELVGGKDAYETIAAPDKVEVWLLTSGSERPKVDRAGPVKLTPANARAFSDPLLNFESYYWHDGKKCIMNEGARLRFTRGADRVDIRLCYECDMLTVTHNGVTNYGDFDYGHDALVKALQAAFPADGVVKGLELKGSPVR